MKNLLLFLFTMPAVFAQNNNVNLQVNEYDVSIHYENAANRPTLYRQYLKSVFYYSDKDSEKVYRLKQWIDNVVIYFDKNIPKQVKREIIQFYLNMPKIENLDLSFTNNIEEANYFVKLVDKTYFNSRSFYKFKNEQEENSFFFNNGSYQLINDNNSNIYGCVLNINPINLKNNLSSYTAVIKQGIFLSLGRFFINHKNPKSNSLIEKVYKNEAVISEFDLNLLRTHYSNLFYKAINRNEFQEILKASK